ncbi:unnamed protein product [Candida verbasci]|uniref:AAA+ ATPase domain-containing protein n=1 Tax=Candida verbasci TaxID=1227364 RepID=A0A9W4TZG3_9ASCO|nr:unnamed protein product [Candida verbasci]
MSNNIPSIQIGDQPQLHRANTTNLNNSNNSNNPNIHSDSDLIGGKKSNKIYQVQTGSTTTTTTTSESEVDKLLNNLSNKQSDNYRLIKFNPTNDNLQNINQLKSHFTKQVSFDNINIKEDDDDIPDDDDDLGWKKYKSQNKPMIGYSRGRSLSPCPGSGRISPIASPNKYDELSGLTPYELKKLEQHLEKNMVQYPTKPITTSRGCSFTKRHKLYESLYNYKLSIRPVLPHRTILIYISARIHTWVALDWILNKFIENGDKIIIVAAIDEEPIKRKHKHTIPVKSTNTFQRYRQRNQPENILTICKDIMNYCMTVMNPNIITRITVELVTGETKQVLKDMYRLYEPNLVCTGTKPNTRTGAPLKSWLSSKLTDRLVKNFPLPVIVVPAVNMCQFENELESNLNGKTTIHEIESDSDSESDVSSIASDVSDVSNESYESYDEIATLYIDFKKDLSKELKQLEELPLNENYFTNFAKLISDTSLNLCEDIIKVQPTFTGSGAKLARMITGSNNFGHQPYKTKSLLAPQEKKPTPKEHKLSFKEVQEQLKLNKIKSEEKEQEENTPPPKQSLKFVNLEKPTSKSKSNDHALAKCLSYDGDNRKSGLNSSRSSLDNKLEPRNSHPGFINSNQTSSTVLAFYDFNSSNEIIHLNSKRNSEGLQEFTPIRDTILQSEVKYYSFSVNTTSGVGEFYELLIFLSGNICNQPDNLDFNDTSLAVYYSFNYTMFQDNEVGQMELFTNGYFQALADLPINPNDGEKILYIAVRAPQNLNVTASWTYQIGVSQSDLVFQWDDRSWGSLVDSDDQSALIVTGNLTSRSNEEDWDQINVTNSRYFVYIYSMDFKDYFKGMNNSWCAVRNGPALVTPREIESSYTTRNGGIQQQFYIQGLNSSTKYIAYVVADFSGTDFGGAVYHPFEFETMSNSACELIYDLNFCNRVAYSVPKSIEFDTKDLYDNHTRNLYVNFSKALQQISCDTVPEAMYSNLKTCQDCANSYKDWLCAVTIPRCTTKNQTGYKLRNDTSQRSDFILDTIKPPLDYYEILPCVNVCHVMVRDCPADFNFMCPTRNESISLSYYWDTNTSNQWPSCNYVGKTILNTSGSTRVMNNNLPWVEKYRPDSLSEVFGQQEIVDTIRKFVESGKLPHLLFYGPPGTGKTSTIIALAKEIYGKNYKNMVLELNASDDRGIDVVRNQIKNFASTRQIFGTSQFKLIILDEADAMTSVAQNSLRRVIEKYTKNCRFCILANYSHKLNPALLSRCTRFRFHPISQDAIKERISNVIIKEKIDITFDALESLIKLSHGDMRKSLNVLQSCFAACEGNKDSKIDINLIYNVIGAPHPDDIKQVLNSILQDDFTTAFLRLRDVQKNCGLSLIDIVSEIIQELKNYQLKNEQNVYLYKYLSDLEYYISRGGNDKIQSSSLIGIVKNGMEV